MYYRSQVSLRQTITHNNIGSSLSNERAKLQLEEERAKVHRITIENRLMEADLERKELELIEMRNRIQNSVDK